MLSRLLCDMFIYVWRKNSTGRAWDTQPSQQTRDGKEQVNQRRFWDQAPPSKPFLLIEKDEETGFLQRNTGSLWWCQNAIENGHVIKKWIYPAITLWIILINVERGTSPVLPFLVELVAIDDHYFLTWSNPGRMRESSGPIKTLRTTSLCQYVDGHSRSPSWRFLPFMSPI